MDRTAFGVSVERVVSRGKSFRELLAVRSGSVHHPHMPSPASAVTEEGLPVSEMTPNEIFELIIKADEKLKYATAAKSDQRRGQARDLLIQARDAAREIGNEGLVGQAETRLGDLDALASED
jgi:hypothetical protein